MSVHIDCLRVVPVSNEGTQYEVTDVNGKVKVDALKLDVNILAGSSIRKTSPESTASASATVHEGQQATRDESEVCGAAKKPVGAANPINTKWIEIGAGVGGALVLCLLVCSGKKPSQVSPSSP